ncbi:MAG: macro domain-containing protein [Planctomycetes bacterium]|nr:macro domain-containing protein [Planctomycetota bacterium]
MLHFVSGDILLSKAAAIGHGIAPNDDFKQGLALALRERFPSMVKDFRHYCHTNHPKAGTAWAWAGVGADGHATRVINLLTQEAALEHGQHPGRAKLENVNHALHALKKLIEQEKLASVALPRLATGVGGLEWKDVEPLLKKVLGDLKVPVYVYSEYKRGVAAKEA